MKITELDIRNFKRIDHVNIEVASDDDRAITITGDNAAGKTTVLDAIALGLSNCNVSRPIRDGADKMTITMVLSNEEHSFTLTRTITAKGGASFKVVDNKTGKQVARAQTRVNAMLSKLGSNPLAFVRLGETTPGKREQAEVVRKMLGIDFETLDSERKGLFERRADVNRELKRLDGQLASLPKPSVGTPDEEVSVSDLIAQRDAEVRIASEYDKARYACDAHAKTVGSTKGEIIELNEKLAKLKERLASEETAQREVEKYFADFAEPDPNKITHLDNEIATVEETNKAVRAKKEREAVRMAIKGGNQKSDKLTEDIKAIDEKKAAMVREADAPVEGMSFDEDGNVLFDGVPLDQRSTGEQVRIATLLTVAANPRLPVVCIREGALISKANMKVIAEAAEGAGAQVWVEKFHEEPEKGAIHMVDGAIEEDNR